MRDVQRIMGVRRWVVPLLAALAVLAVVAVMWSQRPGASGGDAGDVGFAGSGEGLRPGDGGSGGGSPPSAGSEPGSPGSAGASEPAGPVRPQDDGGPGGGAHDVDPGSIAVSSFYAYDGRHLAINYTNGVPACYGKAGTPRVEETDDAVVVTIPRTPVKSDGDRACIDLAVVSSVDVTLSAPLDGRPVRDGARDGAVVEQAAAPEDPDQAS